MSDLHNTEFFEERAAIMEFDGGMTRRQAELLAKVETLAREARPIDARRKWERVTHGGRNGT